MIQYAGFSSGGFVLHKIEGIMGMKVSAWFSQNGKCEDAVYTDKIGRRFAIPKGKCSEKWKRLDAIGNAWKDRQ